MEKNGAIYLRVSTEEQHPENQIADVQRFAEALKYKVIEVYTDKESGEYSDRQEFQRMMTDAKNGKFQTLFIWALDRFSREGIEMTLSHIKRLKEAGVVLKSYQESWLDTSIEGISELLIAVLSYAAKEELKRFRERSMAGKKTMLENQKLIGCYPPYGYKHIKRDRDKGTYAYFEINPSEAEIVKKIFKWYLELESIFLVTKRLYERGIKSRGKGGSPKFFLASMVKKVLIREDYIGNHYFGKSSPCEAKFHIKKVRKSRLTGRRPNPKAEWKKVPVPVIIDEGIFWKAQEIMKKRGRHDSSIKPSKHEYLCKGIVRCYNCHRLYGAKVQNNFQLYSCPQRRTQSFNEPRCKSRTMSRRKLDDFIWDYVKTLIEKGGVLKEKIRNNEEKRKENMASNKRLYDSLLAEKDKLKAQRSKLIGLFSDSDISDSSKDDIKTKLVEFDSKEEDLNQRLLDAERELKVIEDMGKVEMAIERICGRYRGKLVKPSFELKRMIVRTFIEEINIMKDGVLIVKVNISDTGGSELSSLQGRLYDMVKQHTLNTKRQRDNRKPGSPGFWLLLKN